MKSINLLRGMVIALVAALFLTAAPVQTSLFAKDTSGTITHAGKHKDGKHKKHKHKKKNKNSSNNNTNSNNNNTKDTKTNKK